jgi:hypothetical protein
LEAAGVEFGLSAFASGLVLAVFAGTLLIKPFTTPILRRFSFSGVLVVNGLLNPAAIFACAFLTQRRPSPSSSAFCSSAD